MSTNLYQPCEPFRSYNRLEGRPRMAELDDAMAARINDPLWMLARQYQFGEFKGEDAGSAILAKVAVNHTRITSFKDNSGTFLPFDNRVPLETRVERLVPYIDHKTSYKIGKKFLLLLNQSGMAVPGYAQNQYTPAFIQRFPFAVATLEVTQPANQASVSAREKSRFEAEGFVRSLSGRALNGAALWDFLDGNSTLVNQLIIQGAAHPEKIIQAVHAPLLLQVATDWIAYVRNSLNLPAGRHETTWRDEKMEYAFEVRLDEGNGSQTTLHAEEYAQGHLDWFCFEVKQKANTQGPFDENIRQREVLTVIPTEASFAGMPNSRWWEMEDGTIDLGNLKANDTDVAKILVSQFAVKYSNDWLAIPYDLPCGSFTEVEGIVVTDTFGNRTFVEAAHKQNGADWKGWNMFALSVTADEFEGTDFDHRLFLPPAIVKGYEGEEVEKVKFIRDEMANMVWGIESIVPDGLGGGMDGYEAASNVAALFIRLEKIEAGPVPDSLVLQPGTAGNENAAETYKAQLKYMLGNTVSENWIPFIPVHKPGQNQNGPTNREIILQRASMPRINKVFDTHAVRPSTSLLRQGINDSDHQPSPMFIHEEEVPRSGAIVKANYQRARWFHGKVITWYGRKKMNGRGEGTSGLRFDLVVDNLP